MGKKIGILSSHNGSGFETILNAINNNELIGEVVVVISNNTNAPVLQKAQNANIPNYIVNSKNIDEDKIDTKIVQLLKEHNCEYIFLSGYMKKLSAQLVSNYENKIINSHPALLPKFGGKGMYGSFVHEAVIKAKETQSGVTIHFVNEVYDEGEIILQEKIDIDSKDDAKTLEKRIKGLEKQTIINGLKKLLN